jgi:hypothetical protein
MATLRRTDYSRLGDEADDDEFGVPLQQVSSLRLSSTGASSSTAAAAAAAAAVWPPPAPTPVSADPHAAVPASSGLTMLSAVQASTPPAERAFPATSSAMAAAGAAARRRGVDQAEADDDNDDDEPIALRFVGGAAVPAAAVAQPSPAAGAAAAAAASPARGAAASSAYASPAQNSGARASTAAAADSARSQPPRQSGVQLPPLSAVAAESGLGFITELPDDFLRLPQAVPMADGGAVDAQWTAPEGPYRPPSESERHGVLDVWVRYAHLYRSYGLTTMDPYVVITVGGTQLRTQPHPSGGLRPVWNSKLDLYVALFRV